MSFLDSMNRITGSSSTNQIWVSWHRVILYVRFLQVVYFSWIWRSIAMLLPLLAQLMNYTDIYCLFSVLYGITLLINPILGLFSYSDQSVFSIPLSLFPTGSILYGKCDLFDSHLLETVSLWISFIVMLLLSMSPWFLFTAVIVLITNATYTNFRSKVNGIGQVAQAIGRSVVWFSIFRCLWIGSNCSFEFVRLVSLFRLSFIYQLWILILCMDVEKRMRF